VNLIRRLAFIITVVPAVAIWVIAMEITVILGIIICGIVWAITGKTPFDVLELCDFCMEALFKWYVDPILGGPNCEDNNTGNLPSFKARN
jgi:hypothetical protein